MAAFSSGVSTGVKVQSSAATNVPAMFATRTTLQSRPSRQKLAAVGLAVTGNTAVMVISVKSCCRESTAITNPTQ